MALSKAASRAEADVSDPLLDVDQEGMRIPRPQIVMTRKDIGKKYEERLERFRENCLYLRQMSEVVGLATYTKEFLGRLEEAAESFNDLRGPLLAAYPIEVSWAFTREQAEIFHEFEMVAVFTKHAMELLNRESKNKTEEKVLKWCMQLLTNNCCNSLNVTNDLLRHKHYLKAVCYFLNRTGPKPDKFRLAIARSILRQIMRMSRVQTNSTLLRDAEVHMALAACTKMTDPDACLAALASLALISEGKSVKVDCFRLVDSSVDVLLSKVKQAWKSSTKSSGDWSFRELLEVVGLLAKHEENRRALVAGGCLSPLTHLVSSDVLQDETVALKTLCRLSMCDENKKLMVRYRDLIDAVKNKFTYHNNEQVKGLANVFLRTLKEELMECPDHKDIVEALEFQENQAKDRAAENVFAASEERSLSEEIMRLQIPQRGAETQYVDRHIPPAGKRLQVFLSYPRMHREKVKDICMFLLENGFKVWFSMNNMTSDALDAMAAAIESSDVVCICYSEGYYQSMYCEMEAKYTIAKKKRTVFIKMENYVPCGWLGVMMGAAFYVDYTGRKDYAMMRDLLIKELLQRKTEQEQKKVKAIEHHPIQEKGD